MPKGLAVESVEERVAGTIGGGAAAVGLAALAEVLGLATEGTLVAGKSVSPPMPLLVFTQPGPDTNLHLSILGSGEGAAVVLEFDDGGGSLTGHVVDGVLVTEPVGALDGIVHVPSPVVLVHVAERGVDAALGGDCVASRGEELGDASRVEAGLGQAEGGTQTGAAGADNERIVLMVLGIAMPESIFFPLARPKNGADPTIPPRVDVR